MTASNLLAAAHRPMTRVLDRVDNLKERGPGQWLACCPAHPDRNPSLSIRETNDGTVLMKCWAGCDVDAIIQAMNLQLSDLFPKFERRAKKYRDQHWLSHRDALVLLRRDGWIIAIASQRLRSGEPLGEEEMDRVRAATRRITQICEMAGVRDE